MADVYIAAAVPPSSRESAPSDVRAVARGALDFVAYPQTADAPAPREPINTGSSDVRFFGGNAQATIDQSGETRVFAPATPLMPAPSPAVNVGAISVALMPGGAPMQSPGETFIVPPPPSWAPPPAETTSGNELAGANSGVTFYRTVAPGADSSFIPPPHPRRPDRRPMAPVSNEPAAVFTGGRALTFDSDVRVTADANHQHIIPGAEDAVIAPPGAAEVVNAGGADVVMPETPNGEPVQVGGVEMYAIGKGKPKNVKG